MFKLKLTADQIAFLEAALEKAMDNESDDEYLAAYDDLTTIIRKEMANA